jgi:D-alanine-D-alanine ligase
MKNSNQKFGKVAVLMGGTSCEREISLMSGQNVLEALLRRGIDAYAIDVGENIIEQLQAQKPDRAFIVLHGKNGEDGVIQGILEKLNIPYPGSGVTASALTMDKYRTKLVCQGQGLPVLPSILLNETNLSITQFDLPICVKPTDSGSSYGVTKITDISQLPKAYELAKQYGSEVMVEPWIEGREFDVGILGNEALPVVEIIAPKDTFYDYQAKYFSDQTGYKCPCDLAEEEQQRIQNIALQAFHATSCCDWARVEFIQDKNGKFWLLEINTITGLTTHSVVPMAAKHIGIDFDELIVKVLAFSL